MSTSLPPDDFTPRPEDSVLPLPVRGTRYVVGAILVSVIVTVVVTTYLRIEQQLQATMEGKLSAVLEDHVHTAVEWIEERRTLTRKVAELPRVVEAARHESAKATPEAAIELRAALHTLMETGVVKEGFLLSPDASELWLMEGKAPWAKEVARHLRRKLPPKKRRVLFIKVGDQRRIVTFGPIRENGRTLALLALAIPPDSMARGLDSDQNPEKEVTFAFDSEGPLKTRTDGNPSSGAHTIPWGARDVALGFPDGPTRGPHVEEYDNGSGMQVIGAWVWLDKYGVGVATEVPRRVAHNSIELLRQSFLILVTMVGAALLGFIALGRWTLRVREESLLITRRLSRLARAIQPLSAALEHDPSAVLLADHEGSVVYANAASHRVLGVSTPLLGQDVDAVFEGLHTELQSALASGQDSIVAKGNDSLDETLLVSSRSLSIDGAPHFLYMLRPITQQVRRQEVEHWKKLIRVLSHELNNALAPITSLLSSARKVNQMTHRDARLGQIFESIQERTTHLISFLEGYREVARLPRPAQREVDWEVFLESLGSQKQFRYTGSLPQAPGFFDPVQIERVVTNVLNNAHEAGSPEDDVEIEIVEETEGFRINIMDRGSGMPEAVLKQAMLPFFSTKRTGTGVGLALSREIIEAHGGQLTLANRDGGGLIVSCFLPGRPSPPSRTSVGRVMLGTESSDGTRSSFPAPRGNELANADGSTGPSGSTGDAPDARR